MALSCSEPMSLKEIAEMNKQLRNEGKLEIQESTETNNNSPGNVGGNIMGQNIQQVLPSNNSDSNQGTIEGSNTNDNLQTNLLMDPNDPSLKPNVSYEEIISDSYDDMVLSEIVQECKPINLGSVFLYYTYHSSNNVKQIQYKLVPKEFITLISSFGDYPAILPSLENLIELRVTMFYSNGNLTSIAVYNFGDKIFDRNITDSNELSVFIELSSFLLQRYPNLQLNSNFNNQIEDGVYKFTYGVQLGDNLNELNSCNNYSFKSIIDSNGDFFNEYFKIDSGIITGYIKRSPSSQIGEEVWNLSDKVKNDTNKSLEILSVNKYYSNEAIILSDINHPIYITIKDVNNGEVEYYKALLEKVENLDFMAYDSFQGVGFYADPVYSKIDFEDPKSFVYAFIEDASRHGIDLSYVNPDNFSFELVEDDHYGIDSQTSARAYSICNDDDITLTFKRSIWESSINELYYVSVPKSFGIMWHELGHDILNLKHLCLPGHIMSGRHQDPQPIESAAECDIMPYYKASSLLWNNPVKPYDLERGIDDFFDSYYQIINPNCL